MTTNNVQSIDVNVQNKYNNCTRGINMIEVTISEFRKNLKKYSKMLEKDSIMVFNNGKPIINEIEDAVGTRMLYANTNIDAVKEYISWIVKRL